METPCKLMWLSSSKGTAQFPYWTRTVELHKMLNINLQGNKGVLIQRKDHRGHKGNFAIKKEGRSNPLQA